MEREQIEIERIRTTSEMSLTVYQQPLIVTTSGGKDSSVCVALANGPGYPLRYCTTTRRRMRRKQSDLSGKTSAIWWAESAKRENGRGIYETPHKDSKRRIILNNDNNDRRMLFENCRLHAKRICNPVIDWADADIWEYIDAEKLPVNPLYQCGFSRVDCIGCPMTGTKGRQKKFARYQEYQRNYILAFDRMLKERERRGKMQGSWNMGTTGGDMFHWWMEDGVLPGQLYFDDLVELTEDNEA